MRLAAETLRAGGIDLPRAWAAEPELSIADLQTLMTTGSLTARALVQHYLDRIEALNWQGPLLRAVIEVNPDALTIADQLDAERQARGPRGPLHGIPILLKDSIDTADRMMTTAGSYALVGDPPAQDATVARKLRDAGAILLGKAKMTGVDPRDPVTAASAGKALTDYTPFLDPNGLQGARIGVPFGRGSAGTSAAMRTLEAAGAVLVPVVISPSSDDGVQFEYELKPDLNAYLATRTGVPIGSLADLIAFNLAHPEEQLSRYDQSNLLDAQKRGPLTDPAYLATLKRMQTARVGIDTALEQNRLVAIVAPGGDLLKSTTIPLTSRAGYPMISVPAGFDRGLPFSLFFFGTAYSEPILFRLAYAFEQLTRARRPPQFLPSRPLV